MKLQFFAKNFRCLLLTKLYTEMLKHSWELSIEQREFVQTNNGFEKEQKICVTNIK